MSHWIKLQQSLFNSLNGLNPGFSISLILRSSILGKNRLFIISDVSTGNTDQKKTIASIPYIKGTSERIARILRPFNINVAHKPTVTLRNTLMKVKDRIDAKPRKGTVYKVTCAEAPQSILVKLDVL